MLPGLVLALLLALAPQDPASREAEALWARGERAAALEAMAAALDERPEDAALRRRLVERELLLRRFEAALAHAAALGPAADGLRGRALYFLGRYEEALPLLSATDPELLKLRMESLRALGRLDEEAALIPRARALLGAQDPWVLLAEARAAQRAGELERAVERFRAALAADPLSPEARFGLGRALVQQGAREEGLAVLAEHRALVPRLDALDFARRGVELAPMHAANRAALGDAWRALAGFDPTALDRAEAEYALASRLADERALPPVALRHARLLQEDRGDAAAALDVLAAALARVDDARLRVRAAELLAEAGRKDEALAELRRAQALRPDDAEIARRIAALEAGG